VRCALDLDVTSTSIIIEAMSMNTKRAYSTADFAALAGVTPRALRHYDRLGLLTPRRSSTGYRRYVDRDLEVVEEIIALKFIGVPLKQIAGILSRPERPFTHVLRAQREALEAKRRVLARAVDAVTAAEMQLGSDKRITADAIRRIIEVMHMDQNHEQVFETYGAMLKAKVSHLAAMSEQDRAALKQEWVALIEAVKSALDDDPGGPRAQNLLTRWLSLQNAATGGASKARPTSEVPTPELRAELWARRAEWLPADVARTTESLSDANEALAKARALATSFVGDDGLEFIERAKAARR
jgi:DNA-binding transcriptional MerR regulator